MISQHLTNVFKSALFYLAATAILITSCNTTGKRSAPAHSEKSICKTQEIFPLVTEHVHGATIVELSNGDLLAAWFQGSGERWADDVCIIGARLIKGKDTWSEPFVMADVPDFPDINPAMFIDPRGKLWLTWYTVIANQWSTSILKYRISENYMQDDGPPEWSWNDVIHVKPGDPAERGILPNDRFVKSVERKVEEYAGYLAEQGASEKQLERWKRGGDNMLSKARGEDMMRDGAGYAYFQRMGWQTKNKAVFVGDRLILPLYSDGFGFSLMAITDNYGMTWQFSEPLVGAGPIQPSIAIKKDGTLVAYMRDGGPPPNLMHISVSKDKGMSWSMVKDSELPNPGSGADVVTLANGLWVMAYNDGIINRGRQSLAISISTSEGQSWDITRHLEVETRTDTIMVEGSYPSIIQGEDGSLHVIYSYHYMNRGEQPRETIKYAHINEAWIMEGDK
ncbi:MAG: exo-alpha-sialidase [Bacteroidales bacterium]|nr:exo-alpha-sialidase [Bacteroidales bacterium]MDP3001594.1 exo-alpha-sialidase [Bacteroidales bacterium]